MSPRCSIVCPPTVAPVPTVTVSAEFELCTTKLPPIDPSLVKSEQLLGHIAAALLELIDEQPEAVELLRGRTFARTLH